MMLGVKVPVLGVILVILGLLVGSWHVLLWIGSLVVLLGILLIGCPDVDRFGRRRRKVKSARR